MIDVQVRNGLGEIVAQDARRSAVDFHHADAGRFPLLHGVLPWADATFDRSRIESLLVEVERYEREVLSASSQTEDLKWLRDLCRAAMESPDRTLWFVGD